MGFIFEDKSIAINEIFIVIYIITFTLKYEYDILYLFHNQKYFINPWR